MTNTESYVKYHCFRLYSPFCFRTRVIYMYIVLFLRTFLVVQGIPLPTSHKESIDPGLGCAWRLTWYPCSVYYSRVLCWSVIKSHTLTLLISIYHHTQTVSRTGDKMSLPGVESEKLIKTLSIWCLSFRRNLVWNHVMFIIYLLKPTFKIKASNVL